MKSHHSDNSLYTDSTLDLLADLLPSYGTVSVVLVMAGEIAVSSQQANNMHVIATTLLMKTPLW